MPLILHELTSCPSIKIPAALTSVITGTIGADSGAVTTLSLTRGGRLPAVDGRADLLISIQT